MAEFGSRLGKVIRFLLAAGVALSLFLPAGPASAAQGPYVIPERYDPAPSWDISGSNNAHYDWYANEGDEATPFYPDSGPHFYDELFLDFSLQRNPYDTLQGSFSGLWNHSDYRSRDSAFIPEQFRLLWEKGDVDVPYRVELGDFFGFYSFRTMQRSLKGVQVELQPRLSSDYDTAHSIQLTAGTVLPTYDEGAPKDDLYQGISWLVHSHNANLSFNVMRNTRQDDPATETPDLRQTVYSIGGDIGFGLLGQDLTVEGEVAHFDGDLAGTGPDVPREQVDNGYYFQMRGRSAWPLTYRFRFEDYGRDFQPNGGVVTPDRRTLDGRVGWRFPQGLNLTGRLQRFITGRDQGTDTQSDVVGLNLSGPVLQGLLRGLTMQMDAFARSVENRDLTTNNQHKSARLSLSAPISASWSGRLSMSSTAVKDQINNGDKTSTHQVNLDMTRSISLFGLSGSITPGFVLRSTRNANRPEDQYGGNLAVNLGNDTHSLSASYRYLLQDAHTADTVNLDTHTVSASYGYTVGAHRFSVELDLNKRAPETLQNTVGYHAGVVWTFFFDKPSTERRAKLAAGAAPAEAEEEPEVPYEGPVTLAELSPGAPLRDVIRRLAAANIRGGTRLPGVIVYDHQFYDTLSRLQRVAVVHDGRTVIKTAVLVSLADVGDVDTALQVMEELRRTLIQRYGAPRTFDRGQPTNDLNGDINTRRVIRLSEWRTDAGVIRLGFPRRVDGQVRIEVQHAAAFPPPTETLWSVEQVR